MQGNCFIDLSCFQVGSCKITMRSQGAWIVFTEDAIAVSDNFLVLVDGFPHTASISVGSRKVVARGQRLHMIRSEDTKAVGVQGFE